MSREKIPRSCINPHSLPTLWSSGQESVCCLEERDIVQKDGLFGGHRGISSSQGLRPLALSAVFSCRGGAKGPVFFRVLLPQGRGILSLLCHGPNRVNHLFLILFIGDPVPFVCRGQHRHLGFSLSKQIVDHKGQEELRFFRIFRHIFLEEAPEILL